MVTLLAHDTSAVGGLMVAAVKAEWKPSFSMPLCYDTISWDSLSTVQPSVKARLRFYAVAAKVLCCSPTAIVSTNAESHSHLVKALITDQFGDKEYTQVHDFKIAWSQFQSHWVWICFENGRSGCPIARFSITITEPRLNICRHAKGRI